jgi:uncharacterized 2Fe-2S/4Fe-4S cluster protein (DUF4445 family)/predicted metal-binding protein
MKDILKKYFDEHEFTFAFFDPKDVLFRLEYREKCAMNVCGHYQTSWSCPPAIESAEAMIRRLQSYPKGLVFSKVYPLEDPYDYPSMEHALQDIMKHTLTLDEGLKSGDLHGSYEILASGSCMICTKCTYPDQPCRFPEKMLVSMQALGLDVADLAEKVQMTYYHGPKTITYFVTVFFHPEGSIPLEVIHEETRTWLFGERNNTILDVLQRYRYFIESPCGGRGVCGKCEISVDGDIAKACQTKIRPKMVVQTRKPVAYGITDFSSDTFTGKRQTGIGLALDLGTTTLAFYLVNLEDYSIIDVTSIQNDQSIYGADVISRIKAVISGHRDDLNKRIIQQIEHVVSLFCTKHRIMEIKRLVITGNPTMLYLLLNLDPASLGFAPYHAPYRNFALVSGKSMGLSVREVQVAPIHSAFIGSDVVMGVIASGMLVAESALLIDLGTHGEIVLKHRDAWFATSAATGPAFEGATIEMGMGGVNGAINSLVQEAGRLTYKTVSGEAKGISGSGLVDLMAILIQNEMVDESGAITPKEHPDIRFFDDKVFINKNIYITQKDIRQFQLAKAAIHAAILRTMERADCKMDVIDHVFLAGGFGFYLDQENACITGLLPRKLKGKVLSVGNTSGKGAIQLLIDPNRLSLAEVLCDQIQTIDLAQDVRFSEMFVDRMLFTAEGDE